MIGFIIENVLNLRAIEGRNKELLRRMPFEEAGTDWHLSWTISQGYFEKYLEDKKKGRGKAAEEHYTSCLLALFNTAARGDRASLLFLAMLIYNGTDTVDPNPAFAEILLLVMGSRSRLDQGRKPTDPRPLLAEADVLSLLAMINIHQATDCLQAGERELALDYVKRAVYWHRHMVVKTDLSRLPTSADSAMAQLERERLERLKAHGLRKSPGYDVPLITAPEALSGEVADGLLTMLRSDQPQLALGEVDDLPFGPLLPLARNVSSLALKLLSSDMPMHWNWGARVLGIFVRLEEDYNLDVMDAKSFFLYGSLVWKQRHGLPALSSSGAHLELPTARSEVAITFFTNAIEMDHDGPIARKSYFALGRIFEQGHGSQIPRDLQRAITNYGSAERLGHKEAKAKVAAVAELIVAESRAEMSAKKPASVPSAKVKKKKTAASASSASATKKKSDSASAPGSAAGPAQTSLDAPASSPSPSFSPASSSAASASAEPTPTPAAAPVRAAAAAASNVTTTESASSAASMDPAPEQPSSPDKQLAAELPSLEVFFSSLQPQLTRDYTQLLDKLGFTTVEDFGLFNRAELLDWGFAEKDLTLILSSLPCPYES